jgi:5-methylcytosine-specific restriction endonuclease McrA
MAARFCWECGVLIPANQWTAHRTAHRNAVNERARRGSGGGWAETRVAVLKRDGYACTICGSRDRLEVHHIVPAAHGGSDHLANLVARCFAHNPRGRAPQEKSRGTVVG